MKPLNILIVDDDADDKEMFCEALCEIDHSHNCLWAKDGFDALELLNKNNAILPDYIFLDINMPRINGRQCLHNIKTSKTLQNIPVYIYSTTKRDLEKQEMIEMGASGFIPKPDNYLQLVQSLTKIISCSGSIILLSASINCLLH